MVAVHDEVRGVRELAHEAEIGGRAVQHGVDALRPDALLLHRAGEEHELRVVARGDHEVRVQRLDAERDVRHVPRGRGMRHRLQDLEAARRQLRLHQLGEAGAEQPVLVHDHDGLRGLADRLVQLHEVLDGGGRDRAEAGPEAEGVLQAAGHDRVGHSDIHHVGDLVFRGRLRGG